MSVKISGVIKDAMGKPIPDCIIELKALHTTATVITKTVGSLQPEENGSYSMDVELGKYSVTLCVEGYPPNYVGEIYVHSESVPGTLNYYLGLPTEGDLPPAAIQQFEAMVALVSQQAAQVEKDKAAADASAKAAKLSETNAKTSETNAEKSAAAALVSEKAAKTSETNTAKGIEAAAASAQAAKLSENNADGSKKAAQASAAEALASQGAAKTSETNAGNSAKAASGSADKAKSEADRATTATDGKQDKNALLTAIAALNTAADQIITLTGKNSVATAVLTKFAKDMLAKTDAAGVREYLGLKEALIRGDYGVGSKSDYLPASLNGASGFFGSGSYPIEKSPAVVVQSSYGAERRGQFGINMANNAFFRFCNTPSDDPTTHPWKQLVSQGEALLTIDKLFVTSDKNELIRLKTTSKQNYIIGVAADNSAMWYVGNASDANNNVYLNNYKGFNSIAMLDDGTIELKTKESKGIIYTNAAKLMVANSDASNRSIAFGVAGTTSKPSENGSINLWGATSTPFVMEFVTGSAWLMYLRKNADSSRTLLMNGNITCTTLTQTSDRDLKDNLEIIPDALGKLSKLNGYTYNWKETGTPSAGIIAQEVMEVLPEVISTVSNGASRETYIDESGEEQSREIEPSAQERYYAVEYSGLIGLLVAGINEERQMREAMELQAADLTNRLDSLEKSLALILVK